MNTVILIVMLVSLARKPPVAASKEEKNELKERTKIAISVGFLLGLTWLFGLFAVGEATYAFQLIFCIFNAFQGFIIFILYTIRNPIVMKEIKTRLAAWCGCVEMPDLSLSVTDYMSRKRKRTEVITNLSG